MTNYEATLIRILKGEVGKHEGRNADGHWNNIQPYSPAVPGLEWSQGQAWCATFCSWAYLKTGIGKYGPVTASVPVAAKWFKDRGQWTEYPVIMGWVIIGNYEHVGICVGYDDTYVYTIEGNTNDTGSAEGDGVYFRRRLRRDPRVLGYGYPVIPGVVLKSADPALAPKAKPAAAPAGARHEFWLDTAFGFAADKMTYASAKAWFEKAKAAGYTGAILYVSKYPSKNANPVIVKALLDTGLDYALVFEDGTDNPNGGAAQGDRDGLLAVRAAKALGLAPGATVFAAYDRNYYKMVGKPLEYGKAFTKRIVEGLYRTGGYGPEAVSSSPVFEAGWEPATWGTRNGENVVQVVGSTRMPGTDSNEVLRPFPTHRHPKPYATPVKPPVAPQSPSRPLPVVSLGHVSVAAKADPSRPDGGVTPKAKRDVVLVESALVKAGLLPAKYADGSYGTVTFDAVRAWQKQCGVKPTGVLDMVSAKALGARYGFTVKA